MVQDRRPHFPSENHNVKDQSAFFWLKSRNFSRRNSTPRLNSGQKKHRGSLFSNSKKLASGAIEGLIGASFAFVKPLFPGLLKILNKSKTLPKIPLGRTLYIIHFSSCKDSSYSLWLHEKYVITDHFAETWDLPITQKHHIHPGMIIKFPRTIK